MNEKRKVPFETAAAVRVGDTVRRVPNLSGGKDGIRSPAEEARVVYLHPRGRFHVVRFRCGFRECFPGVMR